MFMTASLRNAGTISSSSRMRLACLYVLIVCTHDDLLPPTRILLLQIAFGLNGCYGRTSADTPMDYTNAEALIAATAASPYAASLWGCVMEERAQTFYVPNKCHNLSCVRCCSFEISNEVVPDTISAAAWAKDAAALSAYAASVFKAAGHPAPPFAGASGAHCP